MAVLSFFTFSCLFLLSVETAEVTQALAERMPSLTDKLFSDDVILLCDAVSVTKCAVTCLTTRGSSSFTYTDPSSLSSNNCRCHSQQMSLANSHSPSTDTEHYHFIPTDTSAWLNQTCVTDSDCPASTQAICHHGNCLCHPDHFFSRSLDTCVVNCTEAALQDDWVRYTRSTAQSWHTTLSQALSVADCQQLCVSHQRCQAVEVDDSYSQPQVCVRIYWPLDSDPSLKWMAMPGMRLFKRTCA